MTSESGADEPVALPSAERRKIVQVRASPEHPWRRESEDEEQLRVEAEAQARE